MGLIWRFYQNEQHKWKWQQLSIERTVVEESLQAFHDYESCLADAMECGYVFAPSQPCSGKARFAPITNF